MTGTPSYPPAMPVPGPSPSGMHYVQQFAPARPVATPSPQVQSAGHPLQPMPAHVPHPQAPMQQVPQYSPHPYPQQYTPQQLQPAHYQQPGPGMPPYDHHRPMNPAAMTPSRQPMVPTPNVSAMPHANAHANQYNMPARSYEVYRILDPQLEAGIPEEIRKQYHRDDEGRLLFFSAASRQPARNLVADEYVGLGHSVSHLANIGRIREERRRKRKERDEALANEARNEEKKTRGEEEKRDEELREEGRVLVQGLISWAEEMDRGTAAIKADLEGWGDAKKADARERKAVGV